MKLQTTIYGLLRDVRHRRPSSGTITLEVLVAFSLLVSVLGLSVPLVVRHGRVLVTARHYRLAIEELTNQLERLAAMPEAEREDALAQLTPSEFTAARLPGAELSGTHEPADIGRRVTLRIIWNEPGRRAAPVAMAAWALPSGRQAGAPAEMERP